MDGSNWISLRFYLASTRWFHLLLYSGLFPASNTRKPNHAFSGAKLQFQPNPITLSPARSCNYQPPGVDFHEFFCRIITSFKCNPP